MQPGAFSTLLLIAVVHLSVDWANADSMPPLKVPGFRAEVRTLQTVSEGFPPGPVRSVVLDSEGTPYAATDKGLLQNVGRGWTPVPGFGNRKVEALASDGGQLHIVADGALFTLQAGKASRLAIISPAVGRINSLIAAGSVVFLGSDSGLLAASEGRVQPVDGATRLLLQNPAVNQVAVGPDGEIAVAAKAGLLTRDKTGIWRSEHPRQQDRSWSPHDVRGVAYDSRGRLWFASPQGVGCRESDWVLFDRQNLPYNDFTTLAKGEDGVIWLGTRMGAIRYDGQSWQYRQGRRWLPHDHVTGIAVDKDGNAWLATADGLSHIARRPMTLAQKAAFLEEEIDKRHRRTEFGFVSGVSLKRPGDTREWTQRDVDNDGLWTSMYGAAQCFAYAATRDPGARQRARQAFEALRFLGDVTQGGAHPAPAGFVARTVRPASAPNPNENQDTPQRDRQIQATRDKYWKVMQPRWPLSADGKWYWKSDTSSDELDGHFFFYGLYYDLVVEDETERARVIQHVGKVAGHLVEHGFYLVDHDGRPTRWGVFSPEQLNHNPAWREERGLNSLSILSFLKVAEHVTGDKRFKEAADRLIREHAYDMNVLIGKANRSPGSGNQSDDEMAFMCFYSLLRYESDPRLRGIYGLALRQWWDMERYELNPFFNFVAAASLRGVTFQDPFADERLDLSGAWLEESADTLVRYPLDRINWELTNSHRGDVVPLPEYSGRLNGKPVGSRTDGRVLPIDERFVDHWNHDPWVLDQGGDGTYLADGASFLLPYYMGLYHRFIEE